MSSFDYEPLLLSFKLASLTVILLFIIVLPIAWWLSQTHSKMKPLLEAIFSLPIVLPPSVLGFYLLVAFAPSTTFGEYIQKHFDIQLVFSFTGLVIASMLYSFPFMLQPLQSGFEKLNKNMIDASYLSGKGKFTTLFHVALPNIKPSLVTAIIITFAHTVGEFGVVLMVGGNIPGETKVASVAIYEMVEVMDYDQAYIYSGILLFLSFLVLLGVYTFNRAQNKKLGAFDS